MVDQLVFPNTTWAVPRTVGVARATAGQSAAIAFASSSDRVWTEPVPSRIPPLVTLPDRTMMMLLPMLRICSSIRAVAPDPTATIAITAATPMMIPSMVRADRSLLTLSALNAILTLARIFTLALHR